MTGHLDLDALADAVTGPAADDATAAHLAGCGDCRAALDELRTASAGVSRQLSALPPVALPDDVAARLSAALTDTPSGASVTTLPPARAAGRWQRALPAAAAAVLVLGGAGYAVSQLGGSGDGGNAGSSSASVAKAAPEIARSSTDADYTGRTDLARAVPKLLAGQAPVGAAAPQRGADSRAGTSSSGSALAADPLARLRTPTGLADCLLALLPPDDPSVRPLGLDYASFRGTPALVVLLPGADPAKVDIFVVGAGCSRANDSTLFYTSVARG